MDEIIENELKSCTNRNPMQQANQRTPNSIKYLKAHTHKNTHAVKTYKLNFEQGVLRSTRTQQYKCIQTELSKIN